MKRTKNRKKNRGPIIEVKGSSANELRGRGWSIFGEVEKVEGNIAWVRPTIPGDKLFGVPVRDLASYGASPRVYANPDAEKIASAGKRYERALEQQLRAVQEGRGVEAAQQEVREAKRELSRALGPGVPISVVLGAAGAGLGAAVGGPIGAAAGAVAGGAIPTMLAARRRPRPEGEGGEVRRGRREVNTTRLKNRLMR